AFTARVELVPFPKPARNGVFPQPARPGSYPGSAHRNIRAIGFAENKAGVRILSNPGRPGSPPPELLNSDSKTTRRI
ncbi:MAG: hypothetical protein WCF48_07560, partial [Terriglobales bacterium]